MFKYHLIDLSNLDTNTVSLVDQAYSLWHATYSKILESSGEKINSDDFWRARILAVIEQNNSIIGLHLYNAFDLRVHAIQTHSYLKSLSNIKIEELKSKSIQRLMSGEFLTVHPEFRGKPNGISIAEVIVGLCTKVFLSSPWDAIIGISRIDFKVDKMTTKLGGRVNGDLLRHDVECKIIIATKSDIKPNTDLPVVNMVESLWSQVNNQTPWINTNNLPNFEKRAS